MFICPFIIKKYYSQLIRAVTCIGAHTRKSAGIIGCE